MALGWLGLVLCLLQASRLAGEEELVQTDLGPVIGERTSLKDGGRVRVFRGLPFALPPVGARRWQAPHTSLPRFETPYDARQFKSSCPNVLLRGQPLCRTCSTRSNLPHWPNSEDCLYLNVVTPPDAGPTSALPVAVFVHGGGLTVGWSGVYTNTSALPSKGVVYVTIQYRLAALGFLALRGSLITGNYAVLDVIAALEWVKRRIRFFGGNPERVMIFGQSAGAWLVEALLLSPRARGLFHAAALESSAFLADLPEGAPVPTGEFFKSVGCDQFASFENQIACARERPWSLVVDSAPHGSFSSLLVNRDGGILPMQPREAFRTGRYNRVPVLLGYNLQEDRLDDYFSGEPFLAFAEHYAEPANERAALLEKVLQHPCCGQDLQKGLIEVLRLYAPWEATGYDLVSAAGTDAGAGLQTWLAAQYLQLHSPVYAYVFGARSMSPALNPFGAMHLLELMYVLNDTLLLDGHAMTASEGLLADSLGDAWASFAAHGVPAAVGRGGLHQWRQFNASGDGRGGQWYAIGLPGGVSVPSPRGEQLAFFCKWQGAAGRHCDDLGSTQAPSLSEAPAIVVA